MRPVREDSGMWRVLANVRQNRASASEKREVEDSAKNPEQNEKRKTNESPE